MKGTKFKLWHHNPLLDVWVEYVGFQQGFGDLPGFHTYNLLHQIEGEYAAQSLASRPCLERLGFKFPKLAP